ncbi:hypothetical protein PAMP_009911 [Pampus punctatissimus]
MHKEEDNLDFLGEKPAEGTKLSNHMLKPIGASWSAEESRNGITAVVFYQPTISILTPQFRAVPRGKQGEQEPRSLNARQLHMLCCSSLVSLWSFQGYPPPQPPPMCCCPPLQPPSTCQMWSLVPVHLERHVLSAAAGAKALMENVSTREGRQDRIHLENMEDEFQPQVKKVAVPWALHSQSRTSTTCHRT